MKTQCLEMRDATVLVVGDVAGNRGLLRETQEPEGNEVLLAPDRKSAIKVAKSARSRT